VGRKREKAENAEQEKAKDNRRKCYENTKKRKELEKNNLSLESLTTFRRGKISKVEDRQIEQMIKDEVPLPEIALRTNRHLAQIRNYVRKFYGKGEADDRLPAKAVEWAQFVREFRSRTDYKFLKEHYPPEELDYYEELYAKVMTQFKDDILPTEELQIFQAIDTVIFINRHKKARRAVEDQILELDRLINMEKDGENDRQRLRDYEAQKQALIAQSNYRTKEFTELAKKFDDTIGKLKGTREQRIKNIESSKQSWTSLIKTLQDKNVREREGRTLELIKQATDKAAASLQQPYLYKNGEWDQPMLVPENILIDEDNVNTAAPSEEENRNGHTGEE
jgi:hypothetical protein